MNAYHFFLWGSRIAPLIPETVGKTLCDTIGFLAFWLAGGKRRVILKNLEQALPDISAKERAKVARQVFQENMHYYYDTLRVPKLSRQKLNEIVKVSGVEGSVARAAADGNQGVLLFCGHTGSFNLAIQASTYENVNFYLVIEPVKPPELFDLVRKMRESDPRVHTISVASSEVRNIFRALKQPRSFVCMAIDRDVTENGEPLTFFGKNAKLPTGVAEIALRTRATLIPVYVTRQGKKYHVVMDYERGFVPESTGDKKADVERTAQRMLSEVERIIRRNPGTWLCTQPIWEQE